MQPQTGEGVCVRARFMYVHACIILAYCWWVSYPSPGHSACLYVLAHTCICVHVFSTDWSCSVWGQPSLLQ